MGDRAVVVPLARSDAAVEAIVTLHGRTPLDAVLAVDDQGVTVAAAAAERLGLRHSPPASVALTRDKAQMRECLAATSLPQPVFRIVLQRRHRLGGDRDRVSVRGQARLPGGQPGGDPRR